MTTNNSSGIVFDAKSGISEEEQREILAKINNITEKNRLALSEDGHGKGKGKNQRFKAKKSGGSFPVIVNIIAVAALAGGLALLSSMQWKTDAQVRTGAKVYNNVERALIEEIRKETLSLLEAKEREISLIISKLKEIDAQLFGLRTEGRELTAEETAARNRLRALQEEYSSNLAVLQDERSQILEDARAREAVLRARLENRGRETASVPDASAGGELDQLNIEQIQAAAVEAQMGAFFANLNRQIADNSLDEAAGTIKSMKNFINTPAFQVLRSVQARKEMYTQAIDSFETMVEYARKNNVGADISDRNAGISLTDLQAKITRLEQNLAEKDKTIAAVSSQGSGAAKRLTEMEKTNSTLQTRNSQLQSDLEKQTKSAADSQRDLRTEKAETARLNQLVAARESTLANRNDIITRIRNEVELDRDYDEIPPAEIKTRIARIQTALRSLQ
jgi:chromosome segregation ATPase